MNMNAMNKNIDKATKQVKHGLVAGFLLETDAKRVFFGHLATNLDWLVAEPHMGIDTFATDGKSVWYWPDFVVGLTHDETVGVEAHESFHPGLGHQSRRGDREHYLWNVAGDLEINT